MKRRTLLQWGMGLGATAAAGFVASRTVGNPQPELQWIRRTLTAMGTSMTMQVAHADATLAVRALDAGVAEIRHIEDQMSLFRPDSAICRINRNGRLDDPHPDMLEILGIAQQVAQRSQGAFDVTVQPLWLAFEAAKAQGRLPSPQTVRAARQQVGWRGLKITDSVVSLERPGMGITLNGIAQGYAADKVKARLQGLGIANALIDAGEWAALGQPAHSGDWTLGVANPRDAQRLLTGIAIQGRSVATSADDQCAFSADFVNHHIFDPHTGHSPTQLSSVTVVAPTCVMADALTKVFFMAGFDRALPLAKRWGVDVLVVDKRGRWQASPGVALRQT
jgi:thiamine biosynthesis lipoprotein